MRLASLWMWLETLPISGEIGGSFWFPLFESIHVIAATFVVGSILMVDLRLLDLAARGHPVSRITREVVPWTLGAYALSALAGFAMFVTQATRYAGNRAFQVKFALLLLAGVNMAIFHFRTTRSVGSWDTAARTSAAARLGGALSVVLWLGVMLAGRWVGHLL